jgi:hypothetical protein
VVIVADVLLTCMSLFRYSGAFDDGALHSFRCVMVWEVLEHLNLSYLHYLLIDYRL